MEETLVPRAGLSLETISGGGLHGVGLGQAIRNGWRLAAGWVQARRTLRRFRPNVLLLTGGYSNAPVALAAWEKRVPMVIFLPDIEPGLAIKVLSRLVTRVACTAKESEAFLPPGKMVVTGYPVRPDLISELSTAEARGQFELDSATPTLLVFGGSRGARSINNALMAILDELLADFQVIHISGQLDWQTVADNAVRLPADFQARYRPFPYLHGRMGAALTAADLVVSRAGAATLGEFPALGLPAVLVPYPHAWRYQKVNADYLAAAGAAIRLDDQDMASHLLPTVQRLLNDREALERMRAASRALNRPGAARRVADLLTGLAARGDQ